MRSLLSKILLSAALIIGDVNGGAAHHTSPDQKPELLIFTDRDPDFIGFLITVFAVERGVSVKILSGKPADYEMMRQEDPNFQADVIWATDSSWLVNLTRTGAAASLSSEQLVARIPMTLRDRQGRWFGIGERARVFHVSNERVAEGEISTYEDLADPRWRGRICMRSFRHGYSMQLIGAMIGHYGLDAASLWVEALRNNLARQPEGNDRAQIRAVAEGVCDVAVANSYYRGIMLENPVQRAHVQATRMVIPSFRHGGTHVSLSSASMLADAPHKALAIEFLEFLVSDKAQRILMRHVYEHPVVTNVPLDGQVGAWGRLEDDTLPLPALTDLRVLAEGLLFRLGM